jgi:hypothetical protein
MKPKKTPGKMPPQLSNSNVQARHLQGDDMARNKELTEIFATQLAEKTLLLSEKATAYASSFYHDSIESMVVSGVEPVKKSQFNGCFISCFVQIVGDMNNDLPEIKELISLYTDLSESRKRLLAAISNSVGENELDAIVAKKIDDIASEQD